MARLPWYLKETGKVTIDENGKKTVWLTMNIFVVIYVKLIVKIKQLWQLIL